MTTQALKDHPVPLLEAAIRELRDRSMSLDLYVWLAWRLHTLQRATPFRGPPYSASFGRATPTQAFRPRFTDALAAARPLTQRPAYRKMTRESKLRPSRPPVAKVHHG